MVQTRMVQTRNKLKFDELDKLKELISEMRSNKKRFGPKFTTRSCEFAYNNKRGSKKGSKYKKATSALMMDAD